MDDNSIATPSLAKLAAALVSFQSEVPVIPKSRTAKAGSFSYQYADIADILNAIREPMAKNKLAITQLLIGGKDGFTTIRTTIWHESGENLPSDMEVKTEGKSAQDAGSLFTYYKRYALGAALGIATEEDDDGKAAGSPTPPAAAVKKPAITEMQIDMIFALAKAKGKDEDWYNNVIRKTHTSDDAQAVIDKLMELDDA